MKGGLISANASQSLGGTKPPSPSHWSRSTAGGLAKLANASPASSKPSKTSTRLVWTSRSLVSLIVNVDTGPEPEETFDACIRRVRREYSEDPGLRLTGAQAAYFFALDAPMCCAILAHLVASGLLRRTHAGEFVRSPIR